MSMQSTASNEIVLSRGSRNKRRNNGTLTRATLREAIYTCCVGLSRAEAGRILEEVFDEMVEAVERGEPVKLRSFGSFVIRAKGARPGRNPKTGDEAPIAPRKVLVFKASPMLLAVMNGAPIPDEAE